jgi:hypothetical protein
MIIQQEVLEMRGCFQGPKIWCFCQIVALWGIDSLIFRIQCKECSHFCRRASPQEKYLSSYSASVTPVLGLLILKPGYNLLSCHL